MIILILQILSIFFLITAAISISWLAFVNSVLNSKSVARRWQEKAVGRENVLSWGKVYESSTYKVIAGAVVKLFDADTKEQLDFTVTNHEGEFGFAVPEGKFYLRVNSFYHSFPSIQMLKKYKLELLERREKNDEYFGLFLPEIHDQAYENIYFGEVINNRSRSMQRIFASHAELLEKIEAKTPITLNIPLDKNEILTLDELTIESIKKQEKAFTNIKIVSLIFGLGTIVATIILKINLFDLLLLEAFLVFILYSIFERLKPSYYGHILNSKGKKVGMALIRARGYRTDKIQATAISNRDGKFKISINPGWYYFEISQAKYNSEKRLINLEFKRKINLGFRIKKILP